MEHFGTIIANWGSDWEWVLDHLLDPISHNLWRTGLLDDTLQVCEQVIKYLDSCFKSDNVTVAAGEWQLRRHFILCDMGRFSDAIGMIQHTTMALVPERSLLLPYIVQVHILRRVGRNQEALQLPKRGVAASCRKYWTNSVEVFNLHLDFLLAESAATWGHGGCRERALKHAEWAVAACRKDIGPDEDVEDQKCILIHSLITLSNCLATLERHNKALTAAQEAVLIYTKNMPHMWGDLLYTIRKQELGANVS
jgi:tetratricopeptide (TPR) repeat protein